jgi:hypothetical protein
LEKGNAPPESKEADAKHKINIVISHHNKTHKNSLMRLTFCSEPGILKDYVGGK